MKQKPGHSIQLAEKLRAQPALAVLGEMWQQHPDELDTEYFAFIDWLEAGESRGIPEPRWRAAAAKYDWAARAAAFATADSLDRVPAAAVQNHTADVVLRMAQIELNKLLRMSAKEEHRVVVPVNDLHKLMTFVRDMQRDAVQDRKDELDYSKLEPDEIRELRRLINKAKKTT
ncbi:MAG TPA: hypothetical protein VF092_28170 [Longimicrobium sp.]